MVFNSSGVFLYIFELFAAGEPGGNGPGRTEVLTEPGRDAAGIRCQEGREQEDQHPSTLHFSRLRSACPITMPKGVGIRRF